ncbi:uncharacterized protein BKA78DRAFT_330587 [Phyllosticta capitalensis]|uniref:Arylamine N-acetyltransferase n=1 Tax=Phyllosticta capitalensis TaxID=121624 RepID=A0ABR1YSY5_9PEZI
MEAPRYSYHQIRQYYDRICLNENLRLYDIRDLSTADKLEFLGVLQRHSLSTIPFENLSLHYANRHISLDPEDLFIKQVLSPGRGGYGLENNLVLSIVLRSLGYNVYLSGARVKEAEDRPFSAWSHAICIVTIGPYDHIVDVGFGPNGPTRPLRVDKNTSETTCAQIAPAHMRLVWKNIEGNTDPNQRLWVYQYRRNQDSAWQDLYCFSEMEWLPQDFQLVNYYTSTNPKSWFTQTVICSKMVIDSPENPELIGSMILQNSLTMCIHGRVESQQTFKCEEDRLRALDNVFGIGLTRSEQDGIKGLVTEIK